MTWKGLTPEGVKNLRFAIDRVNADAGCPLFSYGGKGGRWRHKYPPPGRVRVMGGDLGEHAGRAQWPWKRDSGLIRVQDGEAIVPVFMHELGHVLGFAHNDPEVDLGVMNPSVSWLHYRWTDRQQGRFRGWCDVD